MIIWINGAFGSGKTQTASELIRRCSQLYYYDPEQIGYFLRKNLPQPMLPPDFQDIPLWRNFNYEILCSMVKSFQGNIVVPMTITNRQYFDEIIGRLRSNGIEVKHFVLYLPASAIQKRLRTRLEGKSSWAAQQIERCISAFDTDITEGKIDTENMSICDVAETIAKECGIKLEKGRLNPFMGFCYRQKVKLANTRFFSQL